MSPTSYRTAPPRVASRYFTLRRVGFAALHLGFLGRNFQGFRGQGPSHLDESADQLHGGHRSNYIRRKSLKRGRGEGSDRVDRRGYTLRSAADGFGRVLDVFGQFLDVLADRVDPSAN